MTKSSNKFRKPCFWPFLDPFFQFWGQKNFSRKSGFATHNFIWVSSPMPKLRQINDTIPRKCPDRQKDGRTDRPYFIGPFRPKPEIQKLQIMFNLITNVVKCFFFYHLVSKISLFSNFMSFFRYIFWDIQTVPKHVWIRQN